MPQTKAGKASEHRGCSDRGGGVNAVRVNEIGRDTLHDNDDARSKDRGPEIRQDPVGLRMNRPAIPENADRNQKRAGNHEWNAVLGLSDVVVPCLKLCIDLNDVQQTYSFIYTIPQHMQMIYNYVRSHLAAHISECPARSRLLEKHS